MIPLEAQIFFLSINPTSRYKIDPGTPQQAVEMQYTSLMAEFTREVNSANSMCDVTTFVGYSNIFESPSFLAWRRWITIPFRLKGIWSLWQFSFWLQFSFWQFSFWTASRWVHIIAVNVFLLIVTILIVTILTNTKSHYDRIPFNSKGIRDLHWRFFLTVLKKTCSRYRIGG